MATEPRAGDAALPENTKENLDRKLDNAVKETFPTSDPVSVMVTKGEAAYDVQGRPISPAEASPSGTTEAILGRAKETVGTASETASRLAHGAYEQGRNYARRTADRYPEAVRISREGVATARHYAADNPMFTALAGFAIGYALAWIIHSRSDH